MPPDMERQSVSEETDSERTKEVRTGSEKGKDERSGCQDNGALHEEGLDVPERTPLSLPITSTIQAPTSSPILSNPHTTPPSSQDFPWTTTGTSRSRGLQWNGKRYTARPGSFGIPSNSTAADIRPPRLLTIDDALTLRNSTMEGQDLFDIRSVGGETEEKKPEEARVVVGDEGNRSQEIDKEWKGTLVEWVPLPPTTLPTHQRPSYACVIVTIFTGSFCCAGDSGQPFHRHQYPPNL